MNETEWLGQLGAASRPQVPPQVNVVGPVLARIQQPESGAGGAGIWWAAAGLSTGLAVIIVLVAVQIWSAAQEPLHQWVSSTEMVLR